MIVLFWSRATRDLLKSFGWGIRALHQLIPLQRLMVPSPRRMPHSISLLEESGFELLVPPGEGSGFSSPHLCLMTPVQLIGPAGNSRETLFAKSGTDRCYGAGGGDMATSSLHQPMECRDAPAE